MMEKKVIQFMVCMGLLSFCNLAEAVVREFEICILSEPRCEMQAFQKKLERVQTAYIKNIFPEAKIKSFDILLPNNSTELDKFKRLYISNAYPLFSNSHLKGIKEFAERGGLVITSSGLCLVDNNGDFKYDKGDKLLRKKGGIAGLIKFASVSVKTMKIKSACPLTKGLEEGSVQNIDSAAGRTHTVSAEVIVSGKAVYKEKMHFDKMPLVTYKKYSKGAIIFLNIFGKDNLFLKNALTPLTLEWLVL